MKRSNYFRAGRNSLNVPKKHDMCTRGAQRLLQELKLKSLLANRKKGRLLKCCTRTVEMLPCEVIADQHKLLFTLALGLYPNSDAKGCGAPVVRLEKLNHAVTAQVQKTGQEILDSVQNTSASTIPFTTISNGEEDDVVIELEVIDLISSDEEDSSEDGLVELKKLDLNMDVCPEIQNIRNFISKRKPLDQPFSFTLRRAGNFKFTGDIFKSYSWDQEK